MNGRSTSFPGSTPTGAAERGVGQDPGYEVEVMVSLSLHGVRWAV